MPEATVVLGLVGLAVAAAVGAAWGRWRGESIGRHRRQMADFESEQETRRDREALGAAQALLDQLGEIIDLALLRVDALGQVAWVNAVARETWEIDLRQAPSLTAALGSGQLDAWLRELGPGEHLADSVLIRGRRHQVTASSNARGEVLLALRDITDQERQSRSRRDLVSNVSHDLRTPLTTIGLVVEDMQRAPEARPSGLVEIQRQLVVLRKLADDLIQLERIESGRNPLRLLPIRMAEFVPEVLAGIEPQRAFAGLTIEHDLAAAPTVLADPDQLRRVFNNLLDNAIKASPAGSRVTIDARPDGRDLVRVAVSDEGTGIPPLDLDRIFERFHRGDRSRGQSGSGLGLAIVKHIVEGHGGGVGAENNALRGATVWFTLPLA